jgi:hypothetical protein
MVRLPADLRSRGTLAQEAAGRDFAKALERDRLAQLKGFRASLGPRIGAPHKPYKPPPEPNDAVSRVRRMIHQEHTARASKR